MRLRGLPQAACIHYQAARLDLFGEVTGRSLVRLHQQGIKYIRSLSRQARKMDGKSLLELIAWEDIYNVARALARTRRQGCRG